MVSPDDRPAYQQRVIDERDALINKYTALRGWMTGDNFKALPAAEQARMVLQSSIMAAYIDVLNQRIFAF